MTRHTQMLVATCFAAFALATVVGSAAEARQATAPDRVRHPRQSRVLGFVNRSKRFCCWPLTSRLISEPPRAARLQEPPLAATFTTA